MEDVCQKRDSFREPRSWPRENSCSHRPRTPVALVLPEDCSSSRAALSNCKFRCCSRHAVSARHHDNNLRVRVRDLLAPSTRNDGSPARPRYILAPCFRHHLRHPVPADVKRIEPFEAQHSRPRDACALSFRLQLLFCSSVIASPCASRAPPGRFADPSNVVPHIAQANAA